MVLHRPVELAGVIGHMESVIRHLPCKRVNQDLSQFCVRFADNQARRFYLQCSLYVRNDWTPATLLLRFMPGILIADDNANIRVLLRTFIETQTGFKVCAEAKSGVEAIEKAKELLPDVALLDLAMPDLNGIEVASVLKQAVPGIKLILFTMKVDGLGRSLASAIGIDFILSKEESITKLTEHLKSLIPASAAAAPATVNT